MTTWKHLGSKLLRSLKQHATSGHGRRSSKNQIRTEIGIENRSLVYTLTRYINSDFKQMYMLKYGTNHIALDWMDFDSISSHRFDGKAPWSVISKLQLFQFAALRSLLFGLTSRGYHYNAYMTLGHTITTCEPNPNVFQSERRFSPFMKPK